MEPKDRNARTSHDSMMSGSNGMSTSPDSLDSVGLNGDYQPSSTMSMEHLPPASTNGILESSTPSLPANGPVHDKTPHVIKLSSIEHCMPRAYVRVCLAYSLPQHVDLDAVIEKLNGFARRIVDSKPYLSGYVVPAHDPNGRANVAEIHFTDEDFFNYPTISVRHLGPEEVNHTYQELNDQCMPPSIIRPELVSALPEGTDDSHAPVFRIQANVVKGGLIISLYLHHCISDGAGLGFLVTGKTLEHDFSFKRDLETKGYPTDGLHSRIGQWCGFQNHLRSMLSWSSGNQINDRQVQHKRKTNFATVNGTPKSPGCGTVFAFSNSRLEEMKQKLIEQLGKGTFISLHDALLALLWQHMTIARKPSIPDSIRTSKLLIPVNVRTKVEPKLKESYFGAAVDFASAEMQLSHLSPYATNTPAALAETAVAIRQAISEVDEDYIRQLIALANRQDPGIDVRDIMASNMNRTTGADMYVTSWERLELYDATLEMDLGKPDWVRKPWSKDPGSCVVLPRDDRKSFIEVLVQMTEEDMARLLRDEVFMSYVVRTLDAPDTS